MPDAPAVGLVSPLKRGRPVPRDWRARYLRWVRKHGQYAAAARYAGVSSKFAERKRARDPRFNEACLAAREMAADRMERRMLELGERSDNPVPYIVRLKALRPAEYIERHATVSLAMTADVPAADLGAVLARVLGRLSPEARDMLAAPALAALPPAETPGAAPADTPGGTGVETPAEAERARAGRPRKARPARSNGMPSAAAGDGGQ